MWKHLTYAKISGTVWELLDDRNLKLDFERLQKDFGKKKKKKKKDKNKEESKPKKKEKKTTLDGDR